MFEVQRVFAYRKFFQYVVQENVFPHPLQGGLLKMPKGRGEVYRDQGRGAGRVVAPPLFWPPPQSNTMILFLFQFSI